MNRRNKIIIILVIVIIVGIVAVIANSFLSTPTLTLGDKNILVLAVDKNEQSGGGLDMAFMVELDNGTIANYTPVYPGGVCKGNCGI